jgi:signal peptidase II
MIKTTARWASRLGLVVAVVGTIGCDRVTKHLAASALAGEPSRSYLADTIWIGYTENRGGFLSLGAGLPPGVRTLIFTCLTGLMLVALSVVAMRHRWRGWPAIGVALFIAGGVSNWIDRVVHGSVVDFLNVGIGPIRTGVFNVADMAIMLGAVIVVIGFRRAAEGPSTKNEGTA